MNAAGELYSHSRKCTPGHLTDKLVYPVKSFDNLNMILVRFLELMKHKQSISDCPGNPLLEDV